MTPEAEPAQATLTPASLPQVWPLVLAQVGPMLAAYLERAAVVIPAPNSLVLRFASQYNTDREHCQEPGRMTRIVEALRKVTGNTWSVRCDSVQGEAAAPPKVEAPRSRRQRAEALQEPLLKRAVEALGAQIVQMDEGFGAVPAEVSDQPPEEEPLEET